MRDRQRVEELSFAAALGMWANDVILAVYRVSTSRRPTKTDIRILLDAANVVDEARQRAEDPLISSPSRRALAETESTLSAAATLAREAPGRDQKEFLRQVIATLRETATRASSVEQGRLDATIELFSRMAEAQLVESNSVLGHQRSDREAWSATTTTSTSS